MNSARWWVWAAIWMPAALAEVPAPVEIHHVLAVTSSQQGKILALTLDACDGSVDMRIVDFLVARQIPTTIFATRRWIRRNPEALATLTAHAELFDIENHGANHLPAVIGVDRQVYGIAGVADLSLLKSEVTNGAAAVQAATGVEPRWYRGATGLYDPQAVQVIAGLGYKVAGFSVNADHGGLFSKERVVSRLKKARSHDIILAHLNRPKAGTGAGLMEGLAWLQDQGFRFVTLRDSEVAVAR
ncbi:MAG: polysaccharide deacetylase family protein [Burkholderiales bacterium]